MLCGVISEGVRVFWGARLAIGCDSPSLPPHVRFAFEWIQEIYPELVKIAHVAGHDRQPMHDGRHGSSTLRGRSQTEWNRTRSPPGPRHHPEVPERCEDQFALLVRAWHQSIALTIPSISAWEARHSLQYVIERDFGFQPHLSFNQSWISSYVAIAVYRRILPIGGNSALACAVGVLLRNAWTETLLRWPAAMQHRPGCYYRPAVFLCEY